LPKSFKVAHQVEQPNSSDIELGTEMATIVTRTPSWEVVAALESAVRIFPFIARCASLSDLPPQQDCRSIICTVVSDA
jgi:hypothetical protein